jgi:hypothetical protein
VQVYQLLVQVDIMLVVVVVLRVWEATDQVGRAAAGVMAVQLAEPQILGVAVLIIWVTVAQVQFI